jgi:putative two-component system response regulator
MEKEMSRTGPKADIMIVDDETQNLRLLGSILKRAGYSVRPVKEGRQAIEAVIADPPDIIILDLLMPEMSGIDVCRWLKNDGRCHDIPVIFISGENTVQRKVEAFCAGGEDFITKPFSADEVLARIKTHLSLQDMRTRLLDQNISLEQRVAEQVRLTTDTQMALIFALAKLAELRDDDTGSHIERVQTSSKILAEELRVSSLRKAVFTDQFIETLHQAAALHDIGKVGIRDAVLLKPGKLTPDEFEEMKRHCEIGAEAMEAVLKRHPDNQFLMMGIDVARYHHEKWNGAGYPHGLAGESIPFSARILAVADVYDALTNKRCYRAAFSHDEASSMLIAGEGKDFDPEVVTAFRAKETVFKHLRKIT